MYDESILTLYLTSCVYLQYQNIYRLAESSSSHGASNHRHSRQISYTQTTRLESRSCPDSLSSFYMIILSLKLEKILFEFFGLLHSFPLKRIRTRNSTSVSL